MYLLFNFKTPVSFLRHSLLKPTPTDGLIYVIVQLSSDEENYFVKNAYKDDHTATSCLCSEDKLGRKKCVLTIDIGVMSIRPMKLSRNGAAFSSTN